MKSGKMYVCAHTNSPHSFVLEQGSDAGNGAGVETERLQPSAPDPPQQRRKQRAESRAQRANSSDGASSSSPSANSPQKASAVAQRGGQKQIEDFVMSQRGPFCLFRNDVWFPADERKRTHDFSKDPIPVVVSDTGLELHGQGLIVATPELYDASLAGEVDTGNMFGRIATAVGEQRLLVWAFDADNQLVIVRADETDVEDALENKRRMQVIHPPKVGARLADDVTAEDWEKMVKIVLNDLAEDEEIQAWWNAHARIEGNGAPWAKRIVNNSGGAPLGKDSVDAVVNALAKTDLNISYFMDVEPKLFEIGAKTLYAKRTPTLGDGEVLETCEMPDFMTDLDAIPEGLWQEIDKLKGFFTAGFAVISFDGEVYYQAKEEELTKDLKATGIYDRMCTVLRRTAIPEGFWQRVVNEKVHRLEARAAKIAGKKKAGAARKAAPSTRTASTAAVSKVNSSNAEDPNAQTCGMAAAATEDAQGDESAYGGNEDDGGDDRSQGSELRARGGVLPCAQRLSEIVPALFGDMIGSIPVFDVENEDHAPATELDSFQGFRKFTATTAGDIHKILGGSKGGFKVEPFPTLTPFGKPVQSAPAISEVERLYNLGLMVGTSSDNTMLRSSDGRISEGLKTEGLKDMEAFRFLEEVQTYMEKTSGRQDGDAEAGSRKRKARDDQSMDESDEEDGAADTSGKRAGVWEGVSSGGNTGETAGGSAGGDADITDDEGGDASPSISGRCSLDVFLLFAPGGNGDVWQRSSRCLRPAFAYGSFRSSKVESLSKIGLYPLW